MTHKIRHTFAVAALTLSLQGRATVLKTFETKNLEDVRVAFTELTQIVEPSKILLVTDLDNTLLAMDTDLGSEHWYMWQKALIESGTASFPAVAKTTRQMLQVQDVITFLQKMHPTASGFPSFFKELEVKGAARMVLTSRGPTTHDATVREINRNQIALSSEKELQLSAGAVSGFDSGIYLTSGKHKGEMLRAFLKTAGRKFDAVIFTDDRPHHVEGMNKAFAEEREQLISIRFTPVIDEIEAFNRGDKQTVIGQWSALAEGISQAFPASALNVEVVPGVRQSLVLN